VGNDGEEGRGRQRERQREREGNRERLMRCGRLLCLILYLIWAGFLLDGKINNDTSLVPCCGFRQQAS
jgi:hypothetical protein